MGTEENKALMRRWVEEVLNQRKTEAIDDLAAEHFVMHHTTVPQQPREQLIDRQGYASGLPAIFAALPDLHVTIEAMIAEGDLVATLLRATGTHGRAPRHPALPQTGRAARRRALPLCEREARRSLGGGTRVGDHTRRGGPGVS